MEGREISDLTSHAIYAALVQLSAKFYEQHGLPTVAFSRLDGTQLIPHPQDHSRPILLVPRDIVRHLPLASDWSDVAKAISEIEEIRDRFNQYFIGVTQPTITDKKRALRHVALESRQNLRAILDALLSLADNYDPNEDLFNYYAIRQILSRQTETNPPTYRRPKGTDTKTLKLIVLDILDHYRNQIENNNLWEMLWHKQRPKYERAPSFFSSP